MEFIGKIATAGEPMPESGRTFPKEELEKAIAKYNEKETKLGHLGLQESSTVNLDRVSHKVNNVYMKDNTVYAEVTVLDTPMGNITKQLIEADATMTLVPTGTGKVDENNTITDYELTSIDFSETRIE